MIAYRHDEISSSLNFIENITFHHFLPPDHTSFDPKSYHWNCYWLVYKMLVKCSRPAKCLSVLSNSTCVLHSQRMGFLQSLKSLNYHYHCFWLCCLISRHIWKCKSRYIYVSYVFISLDPLYHWGILLMKVTLKWLC